MKHRQLGLGIAAFLGMIVLILDGHTALEGAQLGVELCLKTVIPSLFPFFMLSTILTGAFFNSQMRLLKPLARLFKIPKGAESILIPGLLGGYPVGAQCIAVSYQNGFLSESDAKRMLGFCSNAGPAFLFGMVSSLFPSKGIVWCLWGIHIVSALLTAQILPTKENGPASLSAVQQTSFNTSLHTSLRVMASVCGWVILFRVIIHFLKRWILWIFPPEIQIILIGLLELSNGCCELLSVEDIAVRFLICSGILAFGGLCVTMQTVSVIGNLSIRSYLFGKVLQTIFSLSISMLLLHQTWLPVVFCCVLSYFLLWMKRKKSRFYEMVGV